MEEFIDLFKDISSNYGPDKSVSDKIISRAEQEFKGYSEEHRSRKKEKEDLLLKIKELNRDLGRHKNIKNPRLRKHNAARAKMRKKIRADIAHCRMRLQEISTEEEGTRPDE